MLSRKAIHISVSEDAHSTFRKMCIDHRLTMQEICEYFILGLLDDKPEMRFVFNELSKQKKSKTVRRISNVEYDSIYDAINGNENA